MRWHGRRNARSSKGHLMPDHVHMCREERDRDGSPVRQGANPLFWLPVSFDRCSFVGVSLGCAAHLSFEGVSKIGRPAG